MKRFEHIAGLLVVLAAVSAAHAGLAPVTHGSVPQPAIAQTPLPAAPVSELLPVPLIPQDTATAVLAEEEARPLPPAPSSGLLFVSALAPFGAWRLVRSIRSVRLGHIPDWYHDGGPIQIGHATALEPDFSGMAGCWAATPPEPQETPARHLRRHLPPWRFTSQTVLVASAPRAPPLLGA